MAAPQTFSYTTCESINISLEAGTFLLEVWGASGGSNKAAGGLGGYSRGELTLHEKTKVFVHLGSQGGGVSSPGCNGGGTVYSSTFRSGGGSTDIRLKEDSLYSRVIVAGGGDGELNGNSGKGASQVSETIYCRSSSYSCNKGTFGKGGDGGSSYGGAGGGGWFGGSGSKGIEAGGGGSGYVLTKDSFKPAGYQLNDTKYFLDKAFTFAGNQSFFSPTSTTSNETGHSGHGYARITPLFPYRTPLLTPYETAQRTLRATMVGIKPNLRFTFTSNTDAVVKDRRGIFLFNTPSVYNATINPGRYFFYANGSSCGYTVFLQHRIHSHSPIQVIITDAVHVRLNNQSFIKAPGEFNEEEPYIDPRATKIFNFTMSDFECQRKDGAELIISYNPPKECYEQRKSVSGCIPLIAHFMLMIK